MTTTEQRATRAPTSTRRLAALRGNCMGAAVLLIIQFGLGTYVNLYVMLPSHKSFPATVFGPAALAAHAIVAVVLLAATIAALVRAIRAGRAIVFTAAGFAAVAAAGIAGASFAGSQGNAASLAMALATAVAMFSYLAAVYSLR
ncbi:MAG: hypothetical protein J2P34_10860 [Actinobacteria bacterium]|nr:hypothetical protein [Actinomycetota bacterium]